jgi:hypothetical protein
MSPLDAPSALYPSRYVQLLLGAFDELAFEEVVVMP